MFLGVDIGTGSSKAVLVDADGALVATVARPHATASPRPGWFEHDPMGVWWEDLCVLVAEILGAAPSADLEAISVSGIGPCALIADAQGEPLGNAILYGIDRRAAREIDELTEALGAERLVERTGNRLTTQAVGPKLLWLARHEPEAYARARRWYCASNFLVGRLTGEYVIDHYSASTSDPLYDLTALDWWPEGWMAAAAHIEPPRLAWPAEIVGRVLAPAARATGLPEGLPVLAGTIDALAEAYSAGCRDVGDTMVMYGSTLFLIGTVARPVADPGLWAGTGRTRDTYSTLAGMATSGLVTTWFADVAGTDVGDLMAEAGRVPPGSDGLVLLPYFAGERTPLFDPDARGCWLGLTLDHTRGHLARSILEGVAFGVRHNLETMSLAGAAPRRLVAVGGGTRGDLWTQIVSDITGLPQDLLSTAIGASYGDARMAADALGRDTRGWNPVAQRLTPDPAATERYEELYGVYRRTYVALRDDMHLLARAARLP
jgi:xylulokinase